MDVEDFEGFREGVSGIYSFYDKEINEFALNMWWDVLKKYDLDAVTDAFKRHVINPDSGKWLPKPSDIIRMLQGSSLDAAMVAWSRVDRALRQKGTYVDVVFVGDPLIHRVLHDMGGWIGLGMKKEDEWPFVAREFENRYRAFRERSETPSCPEVLTGIANAHNASHGLPLQPPVLIEDGRGDTSIRLVYDDKKGRLSTK